MSEITVAARIKMARKMAGLTTQAALLKHIPDWRPSRIGNYEAGISMPGPDDILKIAQATSSSPCWLMFGIGPIRPNHRDLQAIRHQNLCNSYDEIKLRKNSMPVFIKALDLSKQDLEKYIDNPFRPISDKLAQNYEQHLNLPGGWMDEQHVEHDPLCLSFPDDMRELMSIYSTSDKRSREVILALVRTLAEQLDS